MGFVDDLLDNVITPGFSRDVPECDDATPAEQSCFDSPSPTRHLSPRDWSGTLRILILCMGAQVVVTVLAFLWDGTRYLIWRFRKKGKMIEHSEKYTYLSGIFDTMDVGMSIACCITFVLRAYASDSVQDHSQRASDIIDFVASGLFGVRFIDGWMRANSRMAYTLRLQALLDVFTITSAIAVPLLRESWLPFTFLRPISMTQALSRLMRVTDLPELYEQLALTLAEFFSMVFTFAGIIFIIENLGNPPGWSDGDDQNFSFMSAIWFVTVTVSTVGYGDFYPISILGRVAGVFFIVIGVIFFGSKTSAIASLMAAAANGLGRYSSGRKPHVLLTGHLHTESLNDYSVEFFHAEHAGHSKADYPVCILSKQLIDLEPLRLSQSVPYHKLQQLTGSVLRPPDLERCKIHSAKACFLLADALSHSPELHDRELLLRALAVKRMNPKIEVYLQLLKGTSLPLAIDMTAVAMNTLKFGLLAKSAVCPGIIPLIGNLLRSIDSKGVKRIGKKKDLKIEPEYLKGMESEIYRCTIPESLRGRKFGDMVEQVYNYKNKGLLLFAVSADRMPGNASMFGSSKDLSGLASQTPGTRTSTGKVEYTERHVLLHPGKDHVVYEPYCMVIAADDPQNLLNRIGGGFFGNRTTGSKELSRKRASTANVMSNQIAPTNGENFSGESFGQLPEERITVHGFDFGKETSGEEATPEGECGSEDESAEEGGGGAHWRWVSISMSGMQFGADGGGLALPGSLGLVTNPNAAVHAEGVPNGGRGSHHDLSSDHEHSHNASRASDLPSPDHRHASGNVLEGGKKIGNGVKPLPPLVEGLKKKRRKVKKDPASLIKKAAAEGVEKAAEAEKVHEEDEDLKPKTPSSALQLHEKSLMLAKLDPPLGRFDPSLLRTHAGWDVVDLKNHIVVCGLPHNVADFLRPIKSAARKQKVTVLFVADWDLSDDQLRMIFPPNIPIHNPWSTLDVFVLHAPPLNPASMKRANVGHASRILLLSEHAGPEAEEPGLMDAAVVFAHRFMTQQYPSKVASIASELRWDESVGFLDDAIRADGAVAPLYLQPSFAEGSVYSASMSTSMLVQAYYNPHLLTVVGKLLSSRITNDDDQQASHPQKALPASPLRTGSASSVSAAEVEMEQEDVDASLEGRSYSELLKFYIEKDLVPMGLYRTDRVTSRCYTFTNPPPDTKVRANDRVFVLARRQPV